MNNLLRLVSEHLVLLVCGGTLFLALGCGAVAWCRSPVHRQRLAELTIGGVLMWMVLALVPMPRVAQDFWGAKLQVAAPTPAALGAGWPVKSAPLVETPVAESLVLPISPEWSATEPTSEPPLSMDMGNESLEIPTAVPSPSEEPAPPRVVSEEAVASAPPWQLDGAKIAGLFTGAYLAGGALCLFWILAGHVLLLRIRQTGEEAPEWLDRQYRGLAKQSRTPPPQLIVSQLCSRPLTWGVMWPVIVLPQSLCRSENKSQLETILLHELGHIAQQDARGNFLFCLALPLLYAHPLYWWLRRESQLAAELVADDWAAWQTGKETYVEELVALARCTGKSSLPLVGVTGLFSSPSIFYRRMHMLLAREKPLSTRTSLPWRLASFSALAGAVALAASLAGVRPAAGQAEPTAPDTVSPPALPKADFVPAPSSSSPVAPAVAAPPATPARGTQPPGVVLPSATPVAAPPALDPKGSPAPGDGARLTPPSADNAGPGPANKLSSPNASELDQLQAEQAAIEAQLRRIQDRLRALGAGGPQKPGAKWSGRAIVLPPGAQPTADAVNLPPGTKTVNLTRVDGDGIVWNEVWSVDENGKPAKIISKAATNKIGFTVKPETSPVPFTVKTETSPDGKVIRTYTVKDGKAVLHVVDAATGKIIETREEDKKNDPNFKSVSQPPGKTPYGVKDSNYQPRTEERYPPATVPAPAGAQRYQAPQAGPSAAGQQQLDLVNLATSYADAVGAVEAAQAKMADIAKLSDSKVISQQEVTAAKLALSSAQRKEQLLRKIAEVATRSAAEEHERTMQLFKSGVIPSTSAYEAQSRLDILNQILSTKPAEGNKPAEEKKP